VSERHRRRRPWTRTRCRQVLRWCCPVRRSLHPPAWRESPRSRLPAGRYPLPACASRAPRQQLESPSRMRRAIPRIQGSPTKLRGLRMVTVGPRVHQWRAETPPRRWALAGLSHSPVQAPRRCPAFPVTTDRPATARAVPASQAAAARGVSRLRPAATVRVRASSPPWAAAESPLRAARAPRARAESPAMAEALRAAPLEGLASAQAALGEGHHSPPDPPQRAGPLARAGPRVPEAQYAVPDRRAEVLGRRLDV
jgi:hypothetical protein